MAGKHKPDTWEEIKPDTLNANKGTIRGMAALETSMGALGVSKGATVDVEGNVIAGNKTVEVAVRLGLRPKVVDVDPDEVLIGRRRDLALYDTHDSRARDLATADNRVAQTNLDWEHDALIAAREQYGSTALETFWHPQEAEEMAVDAALAAQAERADADDEGSPLNAEPVRLPVRKPVVIVECADENQQAELIDLCDERGYRWRTP